MSLWQAGGAHRRLPGLARGFYNRKYGTRYLAAMPPNLYGPGDNYDPLNGHVIPALMRKFHEAKSQARALPFAIGTA